MKIYYNAFKGNNPAAKEYKVATTHWTKLIKKLQNTKTMEIIDGKQRAINILEQALEALKDPNKGYTSITITITKEVK